jgi:undecaprenyl diphosphate synthase
MHIGFIMDGNRRWATKRNLLKHLWHHQGAVVAEEMMRSCVQKGIEEISFWALAKKNILERSENELTYLYSLLSDWIQKIHTLCEENNISFHTVWDLDLLPIYLKETINNTIQLTSSATGSKLILWIGYGGQDEIVRATQKAIQSGLKPEDINETTFLQFLDSGRFPPPDLIIRTGWDTRHSGYFLYQAEYSEYYFTKTLWPDFGEDEFITALDSLKNAKRNFWK